MKWWGERTVECDDYVEGVNVLLDKFEDYPDPIDDWREYDGESGKIVVVMTPVGRLWTFEIRKVRDKYFVSLIGDSWSVGE